MSVPRFGVTYDYRCPFARNAHEHVVEGLRAGAAWDVDFLPFSLTQVHLEEGATPVWDDPGRIPDLLAIEAGMVVRDTVPEHFFDVHVGLFAARHDEGHDLRDEGVIRAVLEAAGVDADEVMRTVADGEVRQAFRKAHESAVANHHIFGVPTFVTGDRAVFVRLMTRPEGNGDLARATVESVLALVGEHPELNEFKHTTISR
jgi:hypothetical protein